MLLREKELSYFHSFTKRGNIQIYTLVLGQKREQSLTLIRRPKRKKKKKKKIPKWIRKLILNTPPQTGSYRSKAPSLSHIHFILGPLRDLVKISASWSLELTKLVVMHPDASFSLIKWQSTSMCNME